MARHKPKKLPPLTPRAREIVMAVVNAVALGTHDDDAEIGALARQFGSTPARLQTIVRRLVDQGWLTLHHDFVYPTVEALRWQNPQVDEKEAAGILRRLK
jgi:DNA-binding IclR family transcriptional regulator